jgi:hypothetical protein
MGSPIPRERKRYWILEDGCRGLVPRGTGYRVRPAVLLVNVAALERPEGSPVEDERRRAEHSAKAAAVGRFVFSASRGQPTPSEIARLGSVAHVSRSQRPRRRLHHHSPAAARCPRSPSRRDPRPPPRSLLPHLLVAPSPSPVSPSRSLLAGATRPSAARLGAPARPRSPLSM